MAGYKKNIHPIVTDEENKFGHEVLLKRIKNGEDPYKILKIDCRHKYYIDKIISGLCPLTHTLYFRITGLRPKYALIGDESTANRYIKFHEKMDENIKNLIRESVDKNAAEITRNCKN